MTKKQQIQALTEQVTVLTEKVDKLLAITERNQQPRVFTREQEISIQLACRPLPRWMNLNTGRY